MNKKEAKKAHDETQYNLSILADKIIKWADEKGILEKATPEKQLLKVIEEHGELAKAILNKDEHEFIDAIGDSFVTVVIHAELCFDKIHFRTLENIHERDVSHIKESELILNSMLMSEDKAHLYSIASLYIIWKNNEELAQSKSFSQCVEVAYNVIANRTGEMKNGTFVKDS